MNVLPLVLAMATIGAPAPLPRKAPVVTVLNHHNIVGHWDLLWCGSTYQFEFASNGTCVSTSGSSMWCGWWALDCRGSLIVWDAQLKGDGSYHEGRQWKVTWKKGLDGVADYQDSRIEVKLRRRTR